MNKFEKELEQLTITLALLNNNTEEYKRLAERRDVILRELLGNEYKTI